MQQGFSREALGSVTFLLGDAETVAAMRHLPARKPFDEETLEFFGAVSAMLRRHPSARMYPDVATLGFWLRKASLLQMRKQYADRDGGLRMSRGTVFHIAPSNVPVNYAYSLAAGALTGNANIVRLPSKDFPQVGIINQALSDALELYPAMRPYLCLVRYGRDKAVNDAFSSVADVRIIWGGDTTITELRKSPLPPRATEVTFADRFSLAVVDSDAYLKAERDAVIARDFYNDTYLSDQNACTSPRLVVWTGTQREAAKSRFWDALSALVSKEYQFQSIIGVNKLTSAFLAAATLDGVRVEAHENNSLIRIKVTEPSRALIGLHDNSGFFFEYDCDDLMALKELCADNRCQTLSYFGEKEMLIPLLKSGIKGVDRVVPIGHTMDFALLWDGYDLAEMLTRTITLR